MRTIIILLISLFFNGLLFAQNIRFSYMANPHLTWFSGKGNNFESNGTFLGYNTGIELDFFFTENYAFSTGITIQSSKGGVFYTDSIAYNTEDETRILPAGSRMKYNLQYVTVPLGLKFKSIEIGYSRYWVNTGIMPMILIGSKVTDESDAFIKTPFKDHTRPLNLNYFVEGGLEYSLGGNTAIIGGLGFYSGFLDITKSDSDKLTTQSFVVILGLLF